MPEERAKEQLEATQLLTHETVALRKSIEESPVVKGIQDTQRKQRNILILVSFVCVVLLLSCFLLWKVAQKADDAAQEATAATEANKANAVTNCQNANVSRRGQRAAWDFVLDVSGADAGPAEAAALEKMRSWFHDLFADRDCSDLSQKYKVPIPPDVKKLLNSVKAAGED